MLALVTSHGINRIDPEYYSPPMAMGKMRVLVEGLPVIHPQSTANANNLVRAQLKRAILDLMYILAAETLTDVYRRRSLL